MGVYEGRGQLGKSIKELVMRWNETKMSWDDVRAHDFEKNFLEPLEMDLKNTVGAMDHMAILLNQIKSACS